MKSLVVYYSHSGNTRKGAYLIKTIMNADIMELIPKKPYHSGLWDAVKEFKEEIENDLRRDLEDYSIDTDKYDMVFIGTPNWGNTVATPLLSFFDNENLSQNRIIPFITHGGGGVGNCAKDIIKLSHAKSYGKEFVYTGDKVNESQVKRWLEKEGLI